MLKKYIMSLLSGSNKVTKVNCLSDEYSDETKLRHDYAHTHTHTHTQSHTHAQLHIHTHTPT